MAAFSVLSATQQRGSRHDKTENQTMNVTAYVKRKINKALKKIKFKQVQSTATKLEPHTLHLFTTDHMGLGDRDGGRKGGYTE